MSAPTVLILSPNERPTAERFNDIFLALQGKFGALDGSDFIWPLVAGGDFNLKGNRLLRAREMMGVLNLAEYGSDDQAFETAINELSGGGIIFIPRNTTVSLPRAVKIRSNRNRVSIIGSGHSSVLKAADNADDPVISIEGGSRFTISNLMIDGNKDNNSTSPGIRINGASDFTVDHVWVGGYNSSLGTAGPGIEIGSSTDFAVRKCWVRNTSGPGIYLQNGCNGGDVNQNTIWSPTDYDSGINEIKGDGVLVDECSDIRVHANHIQGTVDGNGIRVRTSDRVRIYANTIRTDDTDPASGVYVSGQDEDALCDGVEVSGNTVSGFKAGVQIGSFVHGLVHSNHFLDNDDPILFPTSNTSPVTLRNNIAMRYPAHSTVTIPANEWSVHVDIGQSGLPLQGAHATWNFAGSVTKIDDATLSVAYDVYKPGFVSVHNSTRLPFSVDAFLSLFI